MNTSHKDEVFPKYFGRFRFESRVESFDVRISFEQTEFDLGNPAIQAMRGELNKEGILKVCVEVALASDYCKLLKTAESAVDRLMDLIAVSLLSPCGNAVLVSRQEFVLPAECKEPIELVSPAVCSLNFGKANAVISIPPEQAMAKAKQATALSLELLERFRITSIRQSPVDRFMGYYQLMLDLAKNAQGKEEQKRVDNLIQSLRPQAKVTNGPRGAETDFTRLRNEYCHLRPGVALGETVKEIERLNLELGRIARDAIYSSAGLK